MSDLAAWLLEQIDADERAARAATPGPWEWEPEVTGWTDNGPNLTTVAKLPAHADGSVSPVADVISAWGYDAWGITVEEPDAAHVAAWDPVRVLAECEAKRRIVAEHDNSGQDWATERILRLLASVYADRPGYDESWRP